MPDAIVHLSSVAGSPLLDSAGERLGRVRGCGRPAGPGDALPPVIGLVARIGGRELFVPIERIEQLGADAARTSTTKLNLAQFERRPGEVLLRADVLDRSLINVDTARLVTAREVELVCEDGAWRVAGIDPELRRPAAGGCCRAASAATTPSTASSSPGRRSSRSSATCRPRG